MIYAHVAPLSSSRRHGTEQLREQRLPANAATGLVFGTWVKVGYWFIPTVKHKLGDINDA